MTALEGFNTKSTPVSITDADKSISVTINVVNEDSPSESNRAKAFFRVLTAAQYLFLALLGGVFAYILYQGISKTPVDLGNTEAARGLITFLVVVVTVAIALILVMASFLSGGKDVEKRFAFGKEILTILIGVLGTVMGFYYGQAASKGGATNQNTNGAQTQQQTVQIAAPTLNPPAPQVGRDFTLNTTLSGGEKPYKYTVTFTPPEAVTEAAKEATSEDGKITRKFTLATNPDLTKAPVTYKIDVKDSKGATGTSTRAASPRLLKRLDRQPWLRRRGQVGMSTSM